MRTIRIYEPQSLEAGSTIKLSEDAAHHLVRVLRQKSGLKFNLFDGRGNERQAELIVQGKEAYAQIGEALASIPESPLNIELGQAVGKGDRMEYALQKAVELGVSSITPLITDFCAVKLQDERKERKVISWQKIVNSACEQCGRSTVPRVNEITPLNKWCRDNPGAQTIILDPKSSVRLSDLEKLQDKVRLLIGPEGGFSDDELELARKLEFTAVTLGPRILRTETASVAALAVIGAKFGDL